MKHLSDVVFCSIDFEGDHGVLIVGRQNRKKEPWILSTHSRVRKLWTCIQSSRRNRSRRVRRIV